MKKAGIITHYDVHNHGAHLQLYALKQCLKELGYEARALRFQKNYDFMGGAEIGRKYNISIRSIPIYIQYAVSNGVDRTVYNIKKRKTLAEFRKTQGLVGDYYSEAKGLDAVVIGSDEIFSVEAGPNPWYYGIGVPCKYEISYAASFGPTTLQLIDKHNVGGMVEAGLKNLKHIAVRDRNSAELVEHYTGERPIIVCDPVLLYDFPKQLKGEVLDSFKNEHPEKYCIVYSYDYNMNDNQTVEAIKDYARKRGLKIYSVGYYHRWCDRNINVDPLDIIKWFSGAEIVFTDTFHGSVISLETGTQFISQIRANANKLGYLLEQYGVSERIVENYENIERIVTEPIDYSQVNITISKIRKESYLYLKRVLDSNDCG
ncbi:polysaccharide pyruvyl transferase family protein [Eubacterium sp. AB3007]|uniref:polysaccharide pyruvyl transferase family protein n=1 Tax=Eubacterium sp. AB3007 TaxID=1392487 RepID=UPI00047F6187|nr:polysaccharide pyruvyl transferase family protein [Eubacterium sp. AB3007]